MQIKVYQCPKCLDGIYSRAADDRRSCSCGSLRVDGGFTKKPKISATPSVLLSIKIKIVDLNVTEKQLLNDFQYMINKYGLIKQVEKQTTAKVIDLAHHKQLLKYTLAVATEHDRAGNTTLKDIFLNQAMRLQEDIDTVRDLKRKPKK